MDCSVGCAPIDMTGLPSVNTWVLDSSMVTFFFLDFFNENENLLESPMSDHNMHNVHRVNTLDWNTLLGGNSLIW